ncbi:uncharacterized protein JCM15063_004312 [Sporobolomyces koalae]|uniref:uncharacterized protein n=1 Tax=Sporobolomyces koalae TaxID=500713 RepID=UPI003179618B
MAPTARPSKEDRSVQERVEIPLDRLDRTRDILKHDCTRQDQFGTLALGIVERSLKDLLPTIKLVEQSRDTLPSSANDRSSTMNGTDRRDDQVSPQNDVPASAARSFASSRSPASRPLPVSRPVSSLDLSNPFASTTTRRISIPNASKRADVSDHEQSPRTDRTRSHRSRARLEQPAIRTEESRRALEMASAPPEISDDDYQHRRARSTPSVTRKRRETPKPVPKLDQARVTERIAIESDQATRAALVQVSRAYHKIIEPILYGSIVIDSVARVDRLVASLDSVRGGQVKSLEIVPLGANPASFMSSLQALVNLLPHLERFEEDLTRSEWDVQTVSTTSLEYPLVVGSVPRTISTWTSHRCWWEIGAIHALVESQPMLQHLTFKGAAMDRDWHGSRLYSNLTKAPPSSRIESLRVDQVMHEDTLSVLILLCKNPGFRSLTIGFQSIGPSDDDTPLSSIPFALAPIGQTLTSLTLFAPASVSSSKISEDPSTLVRDLVDKLTVLEHLSIRETYPSVPITTGMSTLNDLPRTLIKFEAECLFSISTEDVLGWLRSADEVPRALASLKLEWVKVKPEEEEEAWYRARHVSKIEREGQELGIECVLSTTSVTGTPISNV